jgi:hypothetical protein
MSWFGSDIIVVPDSGLEYLGGKTTRFDVLIELGHSSRICYIHWI